MHMSNWLLTAPLTAGVFGHLRISHGKTPCLDGQARLNGLSRALSRCLFLRRTCLSSTPIERQSSRLIPQVIALEECWCSTTIIGYSALAPLCQRETSPRSAITRCGPGQPADVRRSRRRYSRTSRHSTRRGKRMTMSARRWRTAEGRFNESRFWHPR